MTTAIPIGPFVTENWLSTPAARAVGEKPPANIYGQKWLVVLSGVVKCYVTGQSASTWSYETVSFQPDISPAVNWAIQGYSIPVPPIKPPNTHVSSFFMVEEWAPFASLGSIFDQNESSTGHSVEDWRLSPFEGGIDVVTQQ